MELAVVSLGPVGEWARSFTQRVPGSHCVPLGHPATAEGYSGCEAKLGDPEQGRGGEAQAPSLLVLRSGSPGSVLRVG